MRYLLAVCLVVSCGEFAAAGHGFCGEQGCSLSASCDNCCRRCCPHVETEKIKKECFDVECKQICIPPVQCPWSKGCVTGCARVKSVRVLKKRDYECGEKCVVKWKLEEGCTNCSPGCAPAASELSQPQQTPPPAPPAQSASFSPDVTPVAGDSSSSGRRFSLRALFD